MLVLTLALLLAGPLTQVEGQPGVPPGQPFQALQAQINNLQAQINALASGGGGLDQVRGAVSSGQVSFHAGPTQGTDETALQFPIPQAGEFLSLAINPFSNSLTGTAVLTVRVNEIDTVLQVVITAASTSVVTASAVIPVAPGDLVSLKMDTTGAASGTIVFTAAYVYRAS